MQHLQVSGAVRPLNWLLGLKWLSFPDFMTTAQDGGKVVSLTHRSPLPPRKYTWYSFLLEAESTPGPQCDRKDYVTEKFELHHRESNPRPAGLQRSALTTTLPRPENKKTPNTVMKKSNTLTQKVKIRKAMNTWAMLFILPYRSPKQICHPRIKYAGWSHGFSTSTRRANKLQRLTPPPTSKAHDARIVDLQGPTCK